MTELIARRAVSVALIAGSLIALIGVTRLATANAV